MDDYEINRSTYAVISLSNDETLIIEEGNQFIVNKSSLKIIDNSCRAFGSSYAGRFTGSKTLLGISYKIPIFIYEGANILFFPTASPRSKECCWISFNNIKNYYQKNKRTKIIFKNGTEYTFDVSFYVIENQIFKSAMLQSKVHHEKSIKTP